MRQANFEVVDDECNKGCIIIRDVGPHSQHPTITNDAEGVVERVVQTHGLNGRRLFYYDSQGGLDELDELVVKDGKFAGFKSGKATLVDVEIEAEAASEGGKRLMAWPIYDNCDRPRSGGISCGPVGPRASALAERVKRACLAGKAIKLETTVRSDTGGQTYPNAYLNLRGRALNADLKALGF